MIHQISLLSTLIVVINLITTQAIAYNNTWNLDEAKVNLYLSVAAYCGKENYKTHTFIGPTEGFIVSDVINDKLTDTEGYIGSLESTQSIYVVFRGSNSGRNWITDLDAVKTSYTSFPDCIECKVHQGFYDAVERIRNNMVNSVNQLVSQYPEYTLRVTGHSLGAALAQLSAMELWKVGYHNVSVYNFGSPRVGNIEFSNYVNTKITTWRVVHNTDTVPHTPLMKEMNYYHVCTEVFENKDGDISICDTSCEDVTCSDQFSHSQLNADDHLVYLGLPVDCASVTAK